MMTTLLVVVLGFDAVGATLPCAYQAAPSFRTFTRVEDESQRNTTTCGDSFPRGIIHLTRQG